MLTIKMMRFVLYAVIFLQVVDSLGLNGQKGNCSKRRRLTDEQKRRCALKSGVKQLLQKRNDEWGWGERVEAEAIIGLHLAKINWYSKDNPRTYISVKQMNIDLLSAISKDANLTSTQWGRGKLGHYILGLLATCQDPRDFYGHNLVDILQNHLVVSSHYLNNNKFAYALIVLALCKSNEAVDATYMQNISTTPGVYTSGVDEAAMVYMAYRCVNDPTYSDKTSGAIEFILNEQDNKGLFGNEYSTALAVQAIFASGNKTLKPRTKAGIMYMVKSIDRSEKPFTSLLLSVLPAIAKKSFLDIGGQQCIPDEIQTTTPSTPLFTIGITVINNLTSNFDQSWSASLHQGQTLFDALENLQSADPTFSFTSKSTTWGQFITSVCGMTASTDDRQYWQLLDSNDQPLQQGASQTFPVIGDSYTLKLTTW